MWYDLNCVKSAVKPQPTNQPSPLVSPWACRWINHWSLWCMASETPDLRFPSQLQDITALWLVPNYTAWRQRHVCEQLSRGRYLAAERPGVASQRPNHYTAGPCRGAVVIIIVCLVCQVNGRDMRRVSHRDAVKSLVAPSDEVVIEVSHDPQPPGLQVSHSHVDCLHPDTIARYNLGRGRVTTSPTHSCGFIQPYLPGGACVHANLIHNSLGPLDPLPRMAAL